MSVRKVWQRLGSGVVLAVLLAACSSVPPARREAERRADYEAAAGPSQRSFRFFNNLWSWEPLGNDLLAVYTRPNEAWLLTVSGCTDLEYTNAIGLTSNIHEVSVGFDKVLTGRRDFPCFITDIRPVDVKKLKASQAQRRSIEEKPRDTASPAR